MTKTFLTLCVALAVGTVAHAATVNTTLTVNASGAISSTTVSVSGTATLTTIGSGTLTGSVPLAPDTKGNFNATFAITLSGGMIAGTMVIPAAALTSAGGTATATINGNTSTGSYAGATGTFNLAGTGSIAGTTLTLSFTGPGTITTGGSGGTGGGGGTTTPTVILSAILDGASYSSNVAQGSVFIVKGTNLAPSGFNQSGFPLLTTYQNVQIIFTPAAGGTATNAYLVYTCNTATYGCVNDKTQLAAVLPSTLATGNYNVTVNNGGAVSAPFATQVVQRKPTLISRDSTGGGLAVIQDFTSSTAYFIDSFTNVVSGTGPAYPGSVLVAWATGMGAAPGGDSTASPGYDFTQNGVNVQIIVGGMTITPAYAGRAPGLAGADQINFTLPANVPTGCTVSFQISVNGSLSNPTFISIAPNSGSSACVLPGYTTAQLQAFDQGGSFTGASFDIIQVSENIAPLGQISIGSATGGFTRISGFELASVPITSSSVFTPGACQVTQTSSATGTGAASSVSITYLDAGAITLTGPSGSNITSLALTETNNTYSVSIGSIPGVPGGNSGTIVAGTYKLTGAGGKDVGAFNASVTLGSPITITGGLPSTIVRSAGLTLNWTGGNPTDLVEIIGSSGTSTSTTGFVCITTAGPGTFTVPPSILQQMQATSGTTVGGLEVFDTVLPSSGNGQFTAPLTAGGSVNGNFLGLSGTGNTPAYQ